MQRIQFYMGEDRYVRFLVHASDDEVFTIRTARWSLTCAGQQEADGECLIDEHMISAKISPLKRSVYHLSITYQVADETLIEKVEVVVN